MNAQPQSAPAPDPAANTVNERNPWLGLASFTEETRAYFYGRDEEVAELARRVQRKLLTVLFGQSGLGKTSILRAGLAPRLRAQGYCPIYVRIDYGRDSPEPAEQIKQAISRTARRSGEWTQAGVAVEGESLWEFLHHRDDVLRDESGATLTPLLIFDQFEEIFTLAQSDDFGRARAARFIEELADLVENRPPKSLEAKLEEDESRAERFDFARGDYRVLIALREDYLAPLEGLKKTMPSISQNRLRLAPMTGEQALAAVLQPGKRLVTDEVAAAIVRFVAGGAELAHAEVEPSLLSLICRELNDTRLAQGRDEISLDLLAGSHASILSNFYERSLADQKPAVRQVIEDELLTSSGFRENIAEERLLSRFKTVGAAPDTLAVLVNRRLLRIEERLDVRRVELTHDVLCGVVKSSRDLRREREAREARAGATARAENQDQRRIEMGRLSGERFECPAVLLPERVGFDGEGVRSPQDESAQHDKLLLDRERIGPVNLVAESELAELEAASLGNAAEREELGLAVNRLRGSIGTLNREGRQRLLAAFEAVDGHFRRLFTTLFNGGQAHLELIDSDDPLEAGLEIMAQPPGKKLQSLTLLSGGEQALTAVALIFGLFLTNPAPICVLDEVDAPLDDANIERFCDLLDAMTRETLTRYLIVTHNAVTMSRMHRLFGVTMIEKGVSRLVSVDLGGAERLLAAE